MGQCESTNGGVLNAAPVPDGIDHFVEYNGAGPWFNCEPNAEVAPRMAKRGPAGPDTKPQTFMDLMEKAVANHGDKPALLVERPLPLIGADKKVPPPLPREQWTTWTWKEFRDDSKRSAKAFISLGMQPHESINIWGFNAPEWLIGCVAAMYAGGKCAGLYPTDTAETVAYKVVHSGGSIVISDDRSKIDKIAKALSERKDCTRLKAFVLYSVDVPTGQKVEVAGLGSIPIISWQEMLKMGDKGSDTDLSKRLSSTKPGHCAALIYTSGTTGEPKAVMISHDNFIFEAVTVLNHLGKSCGFAMAAGEERCLSYLPLSHVAGMLLDIVAPVTATAFKPASYTVFFARPYDLKEKAIKDRLGIAKPTVFLGVPLVWEKIADQIRSIAAKASPTQKKVGTWAKGLALQHALNMQLGGSGAVPWNHTLASKILGKIKAQLGLDECKYGFTGAAPIRVDTLEYFGSLGLPIYELYGMSECGGACSVSTEQVHQWGSCGSELMGQEVKAFKCDPADFNKKEELPKAPNADSTEEQFMGELCFRGRNIMMGYLACPDLGPEHLAEIQKKTAEAIDAEGWLHSGDKGMVTEAGMVKITGRYKEIIIGEGGENIAPVPIEDEVKKACDGISEVMMLGDKRKYNVALVTLKAVGANGETPGTDDLDAGARRLNPAVTKISEAIDDKAWIDAVTAAITAANKNGKCCPNNAFKIQKFMILPTNFSEEAGELTPTKKLKRKIVEAKYLAAIDRMYATEGVYIKYLV
mmetsp:Transcript_66727/g.215732  ORF Transcript_66727/g.215732 Transcript_66727/m.215732 type:complete len:754 (-) Transcript_66727:306-2567(-)